MDPIKLKLIPHGRDHPVQTLVMSERRISASVENYFADPETFVLYDEYYSVELEGYEYFEDVQLTRFALNDEVLDCAFQAASGEVLFKDGGKYKQIFIECFGFIRFTLYLRIAGVINCFETDFVQVLVRKTKKYDSVRRMADYVYKMNWGLLYGTEALPNSAIGDDDNRRTIEAKLVLLRKISLVYGENYRYFKANSRFTTVVQERVDDFEKLQYVSSSTIQYIAHHPENLIRVASGRGIRLGNNYYQPSRTLINSRDRSFDIYENQILISFLAKLLNDVSVMEAELEEMMEAIPKTPLEKDDYIASSSIIYRDVANSLHSILMEIRTIKTRFQNFLYLYRNIMKVHEIPVVGVPRLTPIFRAVPQYHQIYDCIAAWLSSTDYSLEKEKYILSVVKISALYELYSLAKILNSLMNSGFALQEINRVVYPFSANTFYRNTTCNNKFVFHKGKQTITVYYQPVIYNEDRRSVAGIGLYRNTSIVFQHGEDDRPRTGSYYSPDYLIKYETSETEGIDYIICDAKYSRAEKVRAILIPQLVFKYLYSVSPFELEDRIVELCILCGISDKEEDGLLPVADYSRNPRREIPAAELLVLTENSPDNSILHEKLLKAIIGRIRADRSLSYEMVDPPHNRVPMNAAVTQDANGVDSEVNSNSQDKAKTDIREPMPVADLVVQSDNIMSLKKQKTVKKRESLEIPLDQLPLSSDLLAYFHKLDIKTIGDVVPNRKKKDLARLDRLNRSQRRHLEGIFKEKGISLS